MSEVVPGSVKEFFLVCAKLCAGIACLALVWMAYPLLDDLRQEWQMGLTIAQLRRDHALEQEKYEIETNEARLQGRLDEQRARGEHTLALEAVRHEAEVKVLKARAEAEVITIKVGVLTPEYTYHLWVEQLSKANTIYVPTEAGAPIYQTPRAAAK